MTSKGSEMVFKQVLEQMYERKGVNPVTGALQVPAPCGPLREHPQIPKWLTDNTEIPQRLHWCPEGTVAVCYQTNLVIGCKGKRGIEYIFGVLQNYAVLMELTEIKKHIYGWAEGGCK